MFSNYLKTALRNLWVNKTYGLLNIFGLSVGVTCAALIFLWIEHELTFDHQHEKRKFLYQVYNNQFYDGKIFTVSATPGPLAQSMKAELPGVRNTARSTWPQKVLFTKSDKSIYENGCYSDSSLFSLFTLPFVEGRLAGVLDDPNSLVISERMARKFFGDDNNIVGKTIKVNNEEDYVVRAVMKDLPENSTLQFEWLAPFQRYSAKNDWLKGWGNNGIQTFVELDPAIDVNTINKKLYNYIPSKDTTAAAKAFLFPMSDWRLHSNFEDGKQASGRIRYIRMFATFAWIILWIACINFMNLATARSEKRAREVGVRKVLGAEKKMLVLQFISEAILMSLTAVLLAVGIIYLVLPSFNILVETKLALALDNPSHIGALLIIALICGLMAGSYPSLYLSSFKPVYHICQRIINNNT